MAFVSAQEASSSTFRRSCHVCLTYRSKDTDKTFLDHLYEALVQAGISTFKNGSELERAENIKSQLQKAIQESRISIIIFTKYFASSKWCLAELVNIFERKKTTGHIILPVFYDVDPSHVRKQKGSYAKAFTKHEERFGAKTDERKMEGIDKVQNWRATLKEIADLAGIVLEDRNESKFIQKIVEDIWNKLCRTVLSVAPYPIGIDTRVKDINLCLHDVSTGVDIVMICGIGGIGKTTLAKTVYDLNFENFESSSFLADIRENSHGSNSLVCLQRRLISDILKGKKEEIFTVDQGIIKIKDALCRKKVLLVLDDVDQVDQLNAVFGKGDWFYPGSKIIITTRHERLLKAHEVHLSYKAKELNYYESLQLFSWHAFGQDHPIKGYMKHSKRIIHHCQGLPLALQVLGSSLSGRSVDFWENALEKLESISESDVLKVLELSYESLPDDHEKNLFLDIACFFVGKDKDYTIKILDECDFYTTAGIQNLIDRCLLRINKDNKLMMHQLLQEMGQEIISRESPKEPGKRTRLWNRNDAFQVLREETCTESIEGLILNFDMLKEDKPVECVNSAKRLHSEDFLNKSTWIYEDNSSKRRCLGSFTWIPINSTSTESFSVSNEVDLKTTAFSRMHKLRLLQLNNVKFSGSYEGFPKKLKWLCWRGFPLKSLPDDFPLGSLVVLEISYGNLEQVWEGTKFLRLLKVLDLSHSHGLTKTPDFSGLPNLERVILKDCTSLVEVHKSIGSLDRLVFLNLRGCGNLGELPTGIGELKSLEKLNLSGCSKLELPMELGKIESLTVLYEDRTVTDQLLSTARKLKNVLLPVKSLYSFFWSWVSSRSPKSPMAFLPRSLKSLDLSGCNLTDDAIPIDLSIVSSLQYLDIGGNPLCSLPESIKGLNMLQSLVIVECTRLKLLPELPLSLMMLDARSCKSLERITNLPNLFRSLDLQLGDCGKLVEVQGLFKLESIGNIDDEVVNLLGLVDLESIRGIEVELCNYLTYTKKIGPVQGLHEFGIFSSFLPGSEVPGWFNIKCTGSPIIFNVPSHCNLKIQGLNVCVVYGQRNEEYQFGGGHYVRIINKTKGLEWIYDPVFFAIPGANENMLWLSHWKFGNQLEGGDQMIVSLNMRHKVREFGINLLYYEQEVEDTQLKSEEDNDVIQHHSYSSFRNVIDGDLSAYQLSTGTL